MASQSASLKLPPDLAEIARLRAQQAGYASLNAYVAGLIRYDAMTRRPHDLTLAVSRLSPTQRDQEDAALLSEVRLQSPGKDSYFAHLLRRLGLQGPPKKGG
jgi:hypothetical protein